jgi:DNA polymerase I-like protein with 3'-5' exonuclease and polymerase domains
MKKLSPTARFVVADAPNIQNIPIRTPEGKAIRDAFTKIPERYRK